MGQSALYPFSAPSKEGRLLWKTRNGVGSLEIFSSGTSLAVGYSMTTLPQSTQFWTSSSSLHSILRVSSHFPSLCSVRNTGHFEQQLQGCKCIFFPLKVIQNLFYLFLLLFKYSCLHFHPTTPPNSTHPHLPHSNLSPLALSICPLYMLLYGPSSIFPHYSYPPKCS